MNAGLFDPAPISRMDALIEAPAPSGLHANHMAVRALNALHLREVPLPRYLRYASSLAVHKLFAHTLVQSNHCVAKRCARTPFG